MVHLDEENWVKAGVEFSDGEATLSSVLTVVSLTGPPVGLLAMRAISGSGRLSKKEP